MIPNPWKRAAVLLPLLVALLASPVLLAQEPAPTPAASLQAAPPAPYLFGNVEPVLASQKKVVDLLEAGRWQEARELARQEFAAMGSWKYFLPKPAATALALEALADAGLGDEGSALCRWYAAQRVNPALLKADLSRFGAAGALLARHPAFSQATTDPEALEQTELMKKDPRNAHEPVILSQSPPLYPERARRAKVAGRIIIQAIIEKDGSVSRPFIIKQGLPEGLDIAAFDAVCTWRYKPATLKGEPIRVYHLLPVDFGTGKEAAASPAGAALAHELKAAYPSPPSLKSLASLEPLQDSQLKVVDLLATQRWQEARPLAEQQFPGLAGDPDTAATALALEALAEAGVGETSAAVCRWNVAQSLDPKLTSADLSPFGAAGELLNQRSDKVRPSSEIAERLGTSPPNLLQKPGDSAEVKRPQIISRTRPKYTAFARRANVEGKVVVESVIEKDGSVSHVRVLQSLTLGLDMSAMEAVCGWRFNPATRNGEPVKVYYVLTVNFSIQKKAPPASSTPGAQSPS
jgi:TonB family protein